MSVCKLTTVSVVFHLSVFCVGGAFVMYIYAARMSLQRTDRARIADSPTNDFGASGLVVRHRECVTCMLIR